MKADSKYFGLDLRFDSGDPTLGSKPGAAGTRLFGGLARGRTLEDKRTDYEISFQDWCGLF